MMQITVGGKVSCLRCYIKSLYMEASEAWSQFHVLLPVYGLFDTFIWV